VVSIAEASMAIACLLGHRFTTLTMLQQFIPYQQDLVRYYGFDAKCASVRAININVEACVTHRAQALRELTEQIRTIVSEDRAEVVILACAGLCGYDQELSRLAGIPVLDPVAVGVKVAESLVALGPPAPAPQRLSLIEGRSNVLRAPASPAQSISRGKASEGPAEAPRRVRPSARRRTGRRSDGRRRRARRGRPRARR
jgi:hypothetical protein